MLCRLVKFVNLAKASPIACHGRHEGSKKTAGSFVMGFWAPACPDRGSCWRISKSKRRRKRRNLSRRNKRPSCKLAAIAVRAMPDEVVTTNVSLEMVVVAAGG